MKSLYHNVNNSALLAVPLEGGTVNALTVTAGGSGYTSVPSVTISASSNGDTATAFATVVGGIVTGLTLTYAGTGYVSAPTVSFSGGGGTLAAATATINSATTSSKVVRKIVIGNPIGSGNVYIYKVTNAAGGQTSNLAFRATLPATVRSGENVYDLTAEGSRELGTNGLELPGGGSIVTDGTMQITLLWDYTDDA